MSIIYYGCGPKLALNFNDMFMQRLHTVVYMLLVAFIIYLTKFLIYYSCNLHTYV